MLDKSSTRRGFLKASGTMAVGGSLIEAPAVATGRLGRSDRIRVAVVGLRGRGQAHLKSLRELDRQAEIAGLCDVDERVLRAAADGLQKLTGRKVATFVDYRKMLEEPAIDAVSLATPDHWHALQTIWACQAGKDIYCEKVASHNIREGRKMVEAARKYRRIVQHGTQARSSPNVREGIRKLKEGVIGRIYMGRAIAYKLQAGGKNKIAPVPQGLDWGLWQGPVERRPYNELIHRKWRYVKDYGNGMIGAQGVHQLDMLRWGIGLGTHPRKVQAMGGNYFHPTNDESTGAEMAAAFRFENPDVLITFETRQGYTNAEAGMGIKYPWCDHRNVVGAIFFGTKGYMIMPDFSSYHIFLGRERTLGPSTSVPGQPMMNTEHFANWLVAVRSRDPRDLTADIEEGHLSSSMCQLGNAAYHTERTLRFDPRSERFEGDDEANALLTRQYHEPYVVPDEV